MTEFNQAEANIPAVKEYLKENPGSRQALLDFENARPEGEKRESLVKYLESQGQDTEVKAPKPVESKAVPVELTPVGESRTFFGKEYEVTPDGGHRLKA